MSGLLSLLVASWYPLAVSSSLVVTSSTTLADQTLPTTLGYCLTPYSGEDGKINQTGGLTITTAALGGGGLFDDGGSTFSNLTYAGGTQDGVAVSGNSNTGVVIDPTVGYGMSWSAALTAGTYSIYAAICTNGSQNTVTASLADSSAAPVTSIIDSVTSGGSSYKVIRFDLTLTGSTTVTIAGVQSAVYNVGAGNSHYMGLWITGAVGGGGSGGGGGGGTTVYSLPITITSGGTYTGNWQSLDRNTNDVTIATTQPVTIINSRMQGKGVNIGSTTNGIQLRVINCLGAVANPDVNGSDFARFIDVGFCKSLYVQYCTVQGGTGIYVNGGGQTSDANSMSILNNRYYNVEGRNSGGVGTYSSVQQSRQFVQWNQVVAPGGLMQWNWVTNTQGVSRPEDNISIHDTRGIAGNPIVVRDNFIQGAYPIPITGGFSGGGIIVDGSNTGEGNISQYIEFRNNVVCGTTNYGVAISTGHHCTIDGNRVIICGKTGGVSVPATNVGIYAYAADSSRPFHDITVTNNAVACLKADNTRNDYYIPSSSVVQSNNTAIGGTINEALENAEVAVFNSKLSANGQTCGSTLSP